MKENVRRRVWNLRKNSDHKIDSTCREKGDAMAKHWAYVIEPKLQDCCLFAYFREGLGLR